jgi:hypothetical protein
MVLCVSVGARGADDASSFAAPPETPVPSLVQDFCIDCHNADDPTAGLDLESIIARAMGPHGDSWERVVRKLRSRQMPPRDMSRPDESTYQSVLTRLEKSLDQIATEDPQPGRTDTFRRLTRSEYQNAIRDLLSLEIDAATWLPQDAASHEFDNVAVGELSPALLNRYVSAARNARRDGAGHDRSGRYAGQPGCDDWVMSTCRWEATSSIRSATSWHDCRSHWARATVQK